MWLIGVGMDKIGICMSYRHCVVAVALGAMLFVVCALTGCGSRGPRVEFVEGIVLLDGEPIDNATVIFIPDGGSVDTPSGLAAVGRTVADGTFHLNATAGARAGAGTSIGAYIVTVAKQEGPPIPEPDASGYLPPAPPNMEVRDVIPKIYGSATTSPLRVDVIAGKNQFRFELESEQRLPR